MEQEFREDRLRLVDRIPLLRNLDPAARQVVAHAIRTRNLERGAQLHHQGDRATALHYLVSGQIARALTSSDGDEKIVEIVLPGEMVGLAEVFTSRGMPCRAEAVEPSTLIEIDKSAIDRAMELDPRLARHIIADLSNRNAAMVRDFAASHFHSGCRRVLDYLRELAGPASGAAQAVSFDLPTRKHLIAARLGLSPETLSRTFRDLSDAGLITVSGRHITLSTSVLAPNGARPGANAATRPVRATDPALP